MARHRPLRNVYQRLGNFEPEIRDIIKSGQTPEILEIGCGFGLPMIQLIRRFHGKVRMTGINHLPEINDPKKALLEGVKRRALAPWVPFTHQLFYPFPHYTVCDASLTLPYPDNHFDFAYSMAATFFFSDRINFLQELNRILKPGAKARLHFTHSLDELKAYGDMGKSAEDLMVISIVDGQGNKIPFPEYIVNFPPFTFNTTKRHTYLEMVASDQPLNLGLKLKKSYPMSVISEGFPQDFPRSEYTIVTDTSS